jgi:hypothetical protein
MITVVLTSHGGLLDKVTFQRPSNEKDVSQSIHDVIVAWNLAPGDTITITESD